MTIQYSIIIPIFNEFNSVLPLYRSICNVMDRFKEAYEIIFVNDGSNKIDLDYLEINMDKDIAKIVNLPKHVGQTSALAAGFKETKGRFVVSMDGDLQDNPKYIPYFISKLYEGFDVVCGYRVKRRDKKNKIILSKIGNFLQRIILRTYLHDISCTYRIYKKECVENLRLVRKGYHRYIPFLLQRQGYKVGEIPIEQGKRLFGRTKYGLCKPTQIITSFLLLQFDILTNKV